MDVNDFKISIIEIPNLSKKYTFDADVIGSVWVFDALKNYSHKLL